MPPHRRSAAGSPPASEPSTGNPFRIGGVVSAPFFTDREPERARVRRALTTDQDHLVVYGTRRMGKTSILRVVQEELRAEEHPVILADLSTAASLAEMTTRILQAATRELGRTWGESATALVQRLRAKVTLEPDATTGMLLPSVDVGLGAADLGTQRTTFASALDAIESLAESREKHLGLILDEFQEIRKFDGETAEAHLRGIIQHHRRVSYVLAGSEERIIQAMIGKSRPFYKLLTPLHVDQIDPAHMAGWLEERLATAGLRAGGIGPLLVRVAGPRTRDIVQLAHEVVDVARPVGHVTQTEVAQAFTQIVQSADSPYRALWTTLSPLQQQVLRVLAVHATGLTTATVRREFGLTAASGSLAKTVRVLAERELLVAGDGRYTYDDPFMRGWVIRRTLPDLGRTLSVLHVPDNGESTHGA